MKQNPYTYEDPNYSKELFYLPPFAVVIIALMAFVFIYATEPQQTTSCQNTESPIK
jgi:hypothetical protein